MLGTVGHGRAGAAFTVTVLTCLCRDTVLPHRMPIGALIIGDSHTASPLGMDFTSGIHSDKQYLSLCSCVSVLVTLKASVFLCECICNLEACYSEYFSPIQKFQKLPHSFSV